MVKRPALVTGFTFTTVSIPAVRRVLIVHGYAGHPDAHWYPWLRSELTVQGVTASSVILPNPQEPDSDQWKEALLTDLGIPDEGTWLVGHSLGCVTVLQALASWEGTWQLGGIVLVAGFIGQLVTHPELDEFLARNVPVEPVVEHCGRIVVVRSDHDPVAPTYATNRLARRLEVEPIVVRGARHFLATDGVTQLPEVRDAILV